MPNESIISRFDVTLTEGGKVDINVGVTDFRDDRCKGFLICQQKVLSPMFSVERAFTNVEGSLSNCIGNDRKFCKVSQTDLSGNENIYKFSYWDKEGYIAGRTRRGHIVILNDGNYDCFNIYWVDRSHRIHFAEGYCRIIRPIEVSYSIGNTGGIGRNSYKSISFEAGGDWHRYYKDMLYYQIGHKSLRYPITIRMLENDRPTILRTDNSEVFVGIYEEYREAFCLKKI